MEEVKNKEIIDNVDKTYSNLIRDKNDYVIEGNFDYLKKNNLLCMPIFRWSDYIKNISKNISKFVKKRNEEKCFIIDKFWNEEKGGPDTKVFESKDLSESFFFDTMDKLNITIFGFFFFKSNLFVVFNEFDYYLIIATKEDIEELTGLTIPELLEYTKEIDWYSDDRPEMYDTYRKFLEDVGVIKE